MKTKHSVEALSEFHDYLGDKGLINKKTLSGRKAAANRILSILDENERTDLRKIDIEQVFLRFINLHGKNFSPGSLRTYKSRLIASLDDFADYNRDPPNFKVTTKRKPNRKKATEKSLSSESKPREKTSIKTNDSTPTIGCINIPVPIRQELIVMISNLPRDLNSEEAIMITNIIKAYVRPSNDLFGAMFPNMKEGQKE